MGGEGCPRTNFAYFKYFFFLFAIIRPLTNPSSKYRVLKMKKRSRHDGCMPSKEAELGGLQSVVDLSESLRPYLKNKLKIKELGCG
jgi:hypothetical protein